MNARWSILLWATMAMAVPELEAFTESPELHRQVEAGQLPPIDHRLPEAPLVITPVEKPGEYGGTWRMALVGYDNS